MIGKSFNSDWYFCKAGVSKEKQEATPVTLPHDAMLLEKRDPKASNGNHTGYFPGGLYRYSKTFFAPGSWRDQNVVFEFEAVYMNSEIYLNGRLAGSRPNGYSNFYIPADGFLKYDQDNEIEVLVRNENGPNSRWYSGSGIHRNVKILVGNHLHIPPDGVKITTKKIQAKQAVVEIASRITNNTRATRNIRLLTQFNSKKSGEIVGENEVTTMVAGGETNTVKQTVYIQNPALWSVDAPNLYACSVKILEGETVTDEDRETFGIRMLAVDSKQGFCLNGETIKLRGACLHHDNGVIGACTLEAAEDRRVRLLKESGFNAIRSAHNPMSKAMLDACDRHGMLVMDEFSDNWFWNKTTYGYFQYFRDWWEMDIQAMVDKDYNHPCVMMYSIGNEIIETAIPEGIEYSRKLADKVRSLDPSRFVINCINGMMNAFQSNRQDEKPITADRSNTEVDQVEKTTNDNINVNPLLKFLLGDNINPLLNFIMRFVDLIISLPVVAKRTRDAYATVDVAGYNYMTGRFQKDGKRYPERVICGSETYPSIIAKNWRLVKKLPHVIGDFYWTGWDYLGEAGLCTWQYGSNQALVKPYPCLLADSPMIDITGHRQTQSYIHEIVWGLRKEPYIAVRPVDHSGEKISKSVWRSTDAIASWTWDGCEGKTALIEVYADADKVELFLNGRTLGKKAAGDVHDFKVVYKTIYRPGELTAVAYAKDGNEMGRTSLKTAGSQLDLRVQAETSKLRGDGADLAYINITLADENGIVKPLADRKVTVHVEGAGSLLGFGSARPFTEESFTDGEYTTYQGRAVVVVRAGLKAGSTQVTISAEGCETKMLTIPVDEPAATNPL